MCHSTTFNYAKSCKIPHIAVRIKTKQNHMKSSWSYILMILMDLPLKICTWRVIYPYCNNTTPLFLYRKGKLIVPLSCSSIGQLIIMNLLEHTRQIITWLTSNALISAWFLLDFFYFGFPYTAKTEQIREPPKVVFTM